MVQMPKMANAKTRHVKDEYRVAVGRGLCVWMDRAAAQIRENIPDEDLPQIQVNISYLAVFRQALQDMLYPGIRVPGPVGFMSIVHRYNNGHQILCPEIAGIIGRSIHAAIGLK